LFSSSLFAHLLLLPPPLSFFFFFFAPIFLIYGAHLPHFQSPLPATLLLLLHLLLFLSLEIRSTWLVSLEPPTFTSSV
jgi:hypothetical protein